MFTVPPGGDGVYYFSTHLVFQHGEGGSVDMRRNDETICRALGDHSTSGVTDAASGSCSVIINVVAGDV